MEPYSPAARAKAMAAPVRMAGASMGNTTRAMVCRRVAPRVAAASSTSWPSSLSTGCTVRTVKGRLINTIATQHAPGGIGDANAIADQQRSHPAIGGIERGQRDTRHRRGQRERQVDHRIQKSLAGKAVARQHPGDDEPEHGIDDGRRRGHAERQAQACQHARRGDGRPEPVQAQAEGADDQRHQRHQHDAGQVEQREAQGQAKSRQHMPDLVSRAGNFRPMALMSAAYFRAGRSGRRYHHRQNVSLCLGPAAEVAIDGGQRQNREIASVRGQHGRIARAIEVAGFDFLRRRRVEEIQEGFRGLRVPFLSTVLSTSATVGSARMERDG